MREMADSRLCCAIVHNFIAAAVVASNVMTRESRLGCKITGAYNFALNKGRTHGENETSNAMFNTALIARSSRDVKNGNTHIKKNPVRQIVNKPMSARNVFWRHSNSVIKTRVVRLIKAGMRTLRNKNYHFIDNFGGESMGI